MILMQRERLSANEIKQISDKCAEVDWKIEKNDLFIKLTGDRAKFSMYTWLHVSLGISQYEIITV